MDSLPGDVGAHDQLLEVAVTHGGRKGPTLEVQGALQLLGPRVTRTLPWIGWDVPVPVVLPDNSVLRLSTSTVRSQMLCVSTMHHPQALNQLPQVLLEGVDIEELGGLVRVLSG